MRMGDFLLKGAVLLIFAFLYAPLAALVIGSFNAGRSMVEWKGFTLDWYVRAFSNERILSAVYNSFWIAGVVTGAAVLMALLAAVAVDKVSARIQSGVNNVLYLSLIVPEIAEALTLVLFFLWVNLPFGVGAVILGHLVWFPLVYVVLRARMAGLPKVYEDAARVLGASGLKTFLNVTLPLLMPGIITGGLLIFTWSWDSFIKTQFTRGPGFETLPVYIWNAVGGRGRGISPEVNAVATISLIISITLAILYTRFRSR
ncbi:MAG: ABC transporter permease [Candidatus Caldarchaeum sp.]|jgi:spermidine/putrescine transport system permease protein|uniref:ABC transporter permease n=1 Tax=Caldiarchaeum subterraneum TaxID=311458 RepID=A0A7C4I6B0_CALS0|nr:ABC transporter permease [Candidatus Caldarchaeales archaeon]MDJ0272486.1 ABC transporter permease [Candidatus Caldarchaeales archaeon]